MRHASGPRCSSDVQQGQAKLGHTPRLMASGPIGIYILCIYVYIYIYWKSMYYMVDPTVCGKTTH